MTELDNLLYKNNAQSPGNKPQELLQINVVKCTTVIWDVSEVWIPD
ncbi:hypothetical protein CAL7716_100990 (plasmid) [Calothrix sp. PCC 7716]|nr:hypothetical protein CAL7716_100990 [Calothrix sp. PCC 7716]